MSDMTPQSRSNFPKVRCSACEQDNPITIGNCAWCGLPLPATGANSQTAQPWSEAHQQPQYQPPQAQPMDGTGQQPPVSQTNFRRRRVRLIALLIALLIVGALVLVATQVVAQQIAATQVLARQSTATAEAKTNATSTAVAQTNAARTAVVQANDSATAQVMSSQTTATAVAQVAADTKGLASLAGQVVPVYWGDTGAAKIRTTARSAQVVYSIGRKRANGKYVVLFVTQFCSGTKECFTDGEDYRLEDSSGRRYPVVDFSILLDARDQFFRDIPGGASSVAGGKSREEVLVFDVAPDAANYKLMPAQQ